MSKDKIPDPLFIHVLGGGVGESIIIEMPTGGWGVVDCYAPRSARPEQNPTLQFLKAKRVKKIDFLCLTHPHDDHFRGMCHLLEHLEVERFWRFAALSKVDLDLLVKHRIAELVEGGELDADGTKDYELSRILDLAKQGRRKPRRLENQAPIYPFPIRVGGSTSNHPFEIWSIGPASTQAERYCDQLRRCFNQHGQIVESSPSLRHNEISVALLIRYGETRVILGGDTEAANWRQILDECHLPDLAVQFVKVSHHGSRTGYTHDLWGIFSAKTGKSLTALIAPSTRHGLPTKDAVSHIRSHAAYVYVTSRSAVKYLKKGTKEFPDDYSSESRAAIRNAEGINGFRPRAPEGPIGCCSVWIDHVGNVEVRECRGGAGKL